MSALRIQGLVFSLSALLPAFAATAIGPLNPRITNLVVAVLILVLGVPHGAFDTIFARQLYGIRTLRDWLRFGLIYLMLAGDDAAALVLPGQRLLSWPWLIGLLLAAAESVKSHNCWQTQQGGYRRVR